MKQKELHSKSALQTKQVQRTDTVSTENTQTLDLHDHVLMSNTLMTNHADLNTKVASWINRVQYCNSQLIMHSPWKATSSEDIYIFLFPCSYETMYELFCLHKS